VVVVLAAGVPAPLEGENTSTAGSSLPAGGRAVDLGIDEEARAGASAPLGFFQGRIGDGVPLPPPAS
jgi:hypothetical protein